MVSIGCYVLSVHGLFGLVVGRHPGLHLEMMCVVKWGPMGWLTTLAEDDLRVLVNPDGAPCRNAVEAQRAAYG